MAQVLQEQQVWPLPKVGEGDIQAAAHIDNSKDRGATCDTTPTTFCLVKTESAAAIIVMRRAFYMSILSLWEDLQPMCALADMLTCGKTPDSWVHHTCISLPS